VSSPIHSDAESARQRRHAAYVFGAALLLLAVNLRLIFPTLSVLLPEISDKVHLSSAAAGYLTTLPVLCLGVFAPLAPLAARRFGIERTLLGALLLLAAGTALRGFHGVIGLFLGSALAGGSIAVANVLMPALVKRDFATRVALMTALYTMALNGGAAVAAAVTLPISHAAGHSWRVGVAVWALPPILAALVWVTQVRRKTVRTNRTEGHARGLWRRALAWQVTFFMGLQSAMAYCVTGWLAPILRHRGMDGTRAGLVTSVCIFMTVAGSVLIPPLVARFRDQRLLNVLLSVVTGVPLLGLLFAPLASAWLWAVLQGLGQGGMFAMALTVIALRSPNARVAAQLSSMAQSIGYMLAAAGPFVVGVLFSRTGGFAASGWLFAGLILGAAASGWGAGRALQVPAHPDSAAPAT
jgi:CP family cyanate transporter-like MFS transporter